MRLTIEIDFDHPVATEDSLGTAVYLLEKCVAHLRDDECDHIDCTMTAGKGGPVCAKMNLESSEYLAACAAEEAEEQAKG